MSALLNVHFQPTSSKIISGPFFSSVYGPLTTDPNGSLQASWHCGHMRRNMVVTESVGNWRQLIFALQWRTGSHNDASGISFRIRVFVPARTACVRI